jgi:hypothetical protein
MNIYEEIKLALDAAQQTIRPPQSRLNNTIARLKRILEYLDKEGLRRTIEGMK